MTSIKTRQLVEASAPAITSTYSISATFSTTAILGLIALTSFKPPLLSLLSLAVISLTSFDLSVLLLFITLFTLSVRFALVSSLITFNRSLVILRTIVLSLFPLLVIPSNSAELATRELNSWLLVKQILKVGLGAELLLLADEPLSSPTLLEAL